MDSYEKYDWIFFKNPVISLKHIKEGQWYLSCIDIIHFY